MLFPAGEPVLVTRNGVTVAELPGGIDPLENRVYLPFGADVRGGDTLSFRGLTRTTSQDVQDWRNPFTGWQAGSVVILDPAPATLPDLGQLLRNSMAAPVLDEETGALVFTDDDPVWTGPVKAEAADSQGLTPELGTQRVGVVPFLLTVPLSLVDVKAGDQFRVLQSRDSRLTTRLLTITAVRASSTSLTRDLVAFDNQGGA
jgi:hypothetical protein